ncbi:16S rRNA (guanine(527)-N(7))-methyltransferase RsmG [Trichlorobacter lovleyi]|uniref:16S rRNA (guanine(527)-N(7))-methyltransferase RsmG n=1 Tax=Trichlorobacter lovleyi TaxID=313985 RepID=UPI002480F6AF|nr:16S rRNA (guanine(527)-N(7))-methyltransferase RsmG [Trichlorobacter lovleyi]
MNRELLTKAVAELNLELTEQQYGACELLLQELLRWNKKINLTAITGRDEMTIKHLIDSLHLVPELRPGDRILDVGSGAGFPALVLAIVRPDCLITSIDAVGKKISFQKHIGRLLKLTNLEPLHGRVELLAVDRSGEFDLVTSRAFSSLELFVELAAPLVSVGGRLVSMRGIDGEQEVGLLKESFAAAGLRVEPAVNYRLPLKMGGRSLVIMRKA